MTLTEVTSKRGRTADHRDAAALPPMPESRVPARRRMRMIPFLITLGTLALAAVLGSAAWGAYMGAPWTRDATVRAYVVTMAPEVAGRIVELHVADNEYVRKGDLLMAIDPTNYTIAVSQAEAAVQQAQASIQNIDAQIDCPAGADQRQPGAAGSGAGGARVRTAAGGALPDPGERWVWQRSECAAVHVRSCISRRRRCRLRKRTSTWRSGRSSR